MTDVIKDVQKQDPGSAFIELFEIDLPGTNAFFHSGLEADLSTLQFRDRTSPGTIREYTALPIEIDGIDLQSAGASPRPTLRVANVLSTFGDEIGITNEDLLGRKIYRRTTLYKYCYGQSGDANPPIEFPQQMWFIDRIAEKTPTLIEFELASPFDLAGVQLPRRQVVANACAWKYQGASSEISIANQHGGCDWDTYGRIADTSGTARTVYFNKKDEEIVSSGLTFNTYSGGSITKGFYYKVAKTGLTQINTDGSYTAGQSAFDYWQATVSTSTPGTASDTNANFRRIRVYQTYSASTTYKAYTDPNYNEFVIYDRGSADTYVRLWQLKTVCQVGSAHKATPDFNDYWQLGDQCSKTLNGCASRFKTTFATKDGSVRKDIDNRDQTLPFGGFPGTKTRS